MKKLRLKALELGAAELLKREQLRNVIGGSGGSSNPYVDGCKACQPFGSSGGNIGCYRREVTGPCLCTYEGYSCDKPRL